MKKIILSVAMLASVAFVACSDDDTNNVEESKCKSCELTVLNITSTTEYCDNENGTYDVKITAAGTSNTQTLDFEEGQTINDLTAALELAGATCK